MSRTRIGLGLAAIGRPDYINIRFNNTIDKSIDAFKNNAFRILDEAYSLDIRDFDVAPSYGLGEQFLLEWNNSRDYKDVSLSTKFGYTYVANWEVGYKGKHEIKEHSLSKLNEQWAISKAFMPNLNIYQIHSATLDSGVLTNTDVLSRLSELKERYQLKIGITSSGPEQTKIIEEAQKIVFKDKALFDSYQVTYNIFEQSCHTILKQLLAEGKSVIIKEAMANGRVFRNKQFRAYLNNYDYLDNLSAKYNVGIDAVALRFVVDNLGPTIVLSGASNTNHLKQNLKAMSFELNDMELSQLKSFAISPKQYWQERSNLEWN
ncbi:aldo/keto reductase [uncultured Winogradskyella sp.]|uniref:aldo/keto reductase n=1 Tax=uncultured Winogradskyella sp. TaxID=395353 RepID=UPI0026144709|nr:aldo/keto reductase [uncultured Winogradskyella sp.]